jgi:FkbM family methyltransferase
MPGWRMLVDGQCDSCGHRYLADLPSGHGLLYPAALDLDTGETFDSGNAPWFADWLGPAWSSPDGGPVAIDIQGSASRPVVLLNCLDRVYGHSLLKLLNAFSHLDDHARDLFVLAPASLESLIPDGVAARWIVREPTARLAGWLLELEERLDEELRGFDDCVLSSAYPHPHPSTYSLDRLAPDLGRETVGTPSVVLSLRADRLWGRDEDDQARRVERFWALLREAFPAAGAVAIGGERPGRLPDSIADATATPPAVADERRWVSLIRGADLAVGVHGSNLLLPSGLARSTLELVPEPRYGNLFQATLLTSSDPFTALVRHRVLYGADDLSDLAPERVASVAVSILRFADRTEQLLTGPAAGQRAGEIPSLAVEGAGALPPGQPGPSWRAMRPQRALRRAVGGVRAAAGRRAQARRAAAVAPPSVLRDPRGLAFELLTEGEIERFVTEGHPEEEELRLAHAYLEPGMTAVDVGANIGAFTVTFADAVTPEGRVYAFEPLASIRERLQRTLELNASRGVALEPCAVSDAEGSATLYDYGSGYESWATLAPRRIDTAAGPVTAVAELTVCMTTLDRYCREHGISHVDLLKIDVEGAEERVLAGARALLERRAIDLVLIEVADTTLAAAGSRAHRVIELLERHGLRTHRITGGRIEPFRVSGVQTTLANVVAASAAARERLRRLA